MSIEQKIIEWSDKILTSLLEYRESNLDFVFWLRRRESSQSANKGDQIGRLPRGYWFPGSDYIFIPFYKDVILPLRPKLLAL